MVVSPHLKNAPYKSPEGGIVHAWRNSHWYTWMFEIDGYNVTGGTVDTWTVHPKQNNVYGKVPVPKQDSETVKFLGTFQSQEACAAACNSSMATKKVNCSDWTWHSTEFGDPLWNGGCYFTLDGVWGPTQEDNVTSARGPHGPEKAFVFGAGGNQGGEGSETAGEWWIDNVFEELDAENEFFFDPASRQLYFIPNATSPPTDVVVPTLANIFEVRGSQAQPVKGVSFSSLKFTATRPTFMEPRSNPSGGDWALERMGALFLQGTENVTIRNSVFERMDSNSIFLSCYNKHTDISHNDFSFLGQSAIAAWGCPVDNDGTNNNFPSHTNVAGNWAHDIGIIQKQSSFYFQAETALTVLENNIVFNIPRAAINFNGTVIINCCRCCCLHPVGLF